MIHLPGLFFWPLQLYHLNRLPAALACFLLRLAVIGPAQLKVITATLAVLRIARQAFKLRYPCFKTDHDSPPAVLALHHFPHKKRRWYP
jgi:hypothetical protein